MSITMSDDYYAIHSDLRKILEQSDGQFASMKDVRIFIRQLRKDIPAMSGKYTKEAECDKVVALLDEKYPACAGCFTSCEMSDIYF